MCGRYILFSDKEMAEIREIIREAEENSKLHVKDGEICPTDIAPVLLPVGDGMAAYAMSWGFPRHDGKGVVFNARSESVADKPMFRDALQKRRCLIPSAGFFEWKSEGKKKIKYHFTLPDHPLLFMAGIYNHYGNAPEEKQNCFSILTTDANQWVNDIHSRMPVVLRESEYAEWLRGPADLAALFDRNGVILNKTISSP